MQRLFFPTLVAGIQRRKKKKMKRKKEVTPPKKEYPLSISKKRKRYDQNGPEQQQPPILQRYDEDDPMIGEQPPTSETQDQEPPVLQRYAQDDPTSEQPLTTETQHQEPPRQEPDIMELITFRKQKTYGTSVTENIYDVNLHELFKQNTNILKLQSKLETAFSKIIDSVPHTNTSKMKMVIVHDDLTAPIIVPPKTDLSVEDVMSTLERCLESYKSMTVNSSFKVVVGVLDFPKGNGKRTYLTSGLLNVKNKRSIVEINSKENCAARAIAVGLSKLYIKPEAEVGVAHSQHFAPTVEKILLTKKCTKSHYKKLRENHRNMQAKMADLLIQNVGLKSGEGVSIDNLHVFENFLDVNIAVVSLRNQHRFVKVPSVPDRPTIYLYLVEDHYHCIVSITGFFSCNNFCAKCLKPFSYKNQHHCDLHCSICQSFNCLREENIVQCPSCHAKCRNEQCFARHQKVCALFTYCVRCGRRYKSDESHDCDTYPCQNCKKMVKTGHCCYLRAKVPKPFVKKFVFYDMETRQDEIHQCDMGYEPMEDGVRCKHCDEVSCGNPIHKVNFVVAHTVCVNCMENYDEQSCVTCKSRHYFDTSEQFCKWLFEQKDATVIAHNAKSFDGYFILKYMSELSFAPENPIFNGTKVLYMEIKKGMNLRFLDSYNFLPMRLAALPKAFGLTELKQGYFPHLFNTLVHRDYVGRLPDKSYYDPDNMKEDDRRVFLEWYESNKDHTFDFKKELREYCNSDVDILKKSCLTYRSNIIEICGFDPFTLITAAGVAMETYKINFMEETRNVTLKDGSVKTTRYRNGQYLDTNEQVVKDEFIESPLAKTPPGGYVTNVRYSKVSVVWLDWIAEKENRVILHALNGYGEQKVGKYFVDGMCDDTVYEFNGCLYHGCPTCYPLDRDRTLVAPSNTPVSILKHKHDNKVRYLEKSGYTVVVMWECRFREMMKSDPELARFYDQHPFPDRLDPKDSFFGGRTNAIRLHHEVGPGEEIRYVDFTSLYPYVNKYGVYPVGHPEVITSDFGPLTEYFGIAKVKILPPRGLYLPVLPYKSNGKLTFPLCKRCVDLQIQDLCTCTDEQRVLIGTWCIPELLKALDMGYSLVTVYEIYHFPNTSDTLFKSYVNTFLKIKQEASGWPSWVKDEKDRKTYVDNYEKAEGIRLTDVEKNPGKRTISKIELNSLWGKFAQKANHPKTRYFLPDQEHEMFSIVTDPKVKLKDFFVVNELLYTVTESHVDESYFTDLSNIFVATFTTCYARLKLYDVMQTLNDRVLYHDTDSVIYIHTPEGPNPKLGDYLGELTNELNEDEHIVEFVSTGPKNYAYKTNKNTHVCKVKGFVLNHKNSRSIHMDTMKELVHETTSDLRTTDKRIERDRKNHTLYNVSREKSFSLVYTKRVLDPIKLLTYPYGY